VIVAVADGAEPTVRAAMVAYQPVVLVGDDLNTRSRSTTALGLCRMRTWPWESARAMKLPKATGRGAGMEMAYRERWEAEIEEIRRVLAGFAMKEECKWGKPTYTVDGKNIVIMQGFNEYFALGFFQGALLKDPKKVLVQLGQVQAGG
jgi:hypothetical protein